LHQDHCLLVHTFPQAEGTYLPSFVLALPSFVQVEASVLDVASSCIVVVVVEVASDIAVGQVAVAVVDTLTVVAIVTNINK
jgi:hypothetical protein